MKTVRTAVQYVTVDMHHEGQRIDNFLLQHCRKIPKSLVYRIIRKGEVRVNGKRVKAPYKLCIGDVVRVPPMSLVPEPNTLRVSPKFNPEVLFENKDFLVVDKPSGVAVHGGSGVSWGIIEALRATREHSEGLQLVHRLDKETSGLLLVSKRPRILRLLHEMLREKRLKKTYLALLHGAWPYEKQKLSVKQPLKKITTASGERIVCVDEQGKESQTDFVCLKSWESYCLVEARPKTGRTHQIRVHAKYLDLPIVGDSKYATRTLNTEFSQRFHENQLFLHASCLHFKLENYDTVCHFESTMPQRFQNVLAIMNKTLKRTDIE